AGAKPNVGARGGKWAVKGVPCYTPLLKAASVGDAEQLDSKAKAASVEIVRLLLAAGANPNSGICYGDFKLNPLASAAEAGSKPIAQRLLDHGAKTDAPFLDDEAREMLARLVGKRPRRPR